jgi:predicted  nucleic acid-binding Zn-ribbon protein
MTFEEMERTMQFIVEQQAKFEVDIAEVRGAISEVKATAAKHNESIVGLVQISRTLIDSQIAAEGRMARIEEKMAELAEAEKHTDQRLDAFIDFFERYMSSHNGGKPAQ